MDIKFYWINIDKSIDRRIFMEEQFKLNNINNQRISAITPDSLDYILEDKPPYDCGCSACNYNDHKDCKFEYSCTCSHLIAIKEGYKSGDKYFIICEDDIYFPFKINFDKIIESLPVDFDICQLMVLDADGNTYLYNECYKNNSKFYINFDTTKKFFSTGMYLISRNGARKLINKFINKQSLKFDFRNISSLKQADFILYMHINTYTLTFPMCFPTLIFISEIHPHHYFLHKNSIDKIIEIINDDKLQHPFIDKLLYTYNDFYNHYKDLTNNKN